MTTPLRWEPSSGSPVRLSDVVTGDLAAAWTRRSVDAQAALDDVPRLHRPRPVLVSRRVID